MNTIQPLSKSIAKGSNYSVWTGTTDFSCLAQGPFYRPNVRPLSLSCQEKYFGRTCTRFSLTRYAQVQRALNRNISSYRHRIQLRPDGPLGCSADLTFYPPMLNASNLRYYKADLATEWERQLTTRKRAERTQLDFRSLICRRAIGHASCLISARRRHLMFPFCF